MTHSHPIAPFTRPKVRTLVVYFVFLILLLVFVLVGLQFSIQTNLADPLWVMGLYIVAFIGLSLWLRGTLQQQGIQMVWLVGQRPEHPQWPMLGGLVVAALVFSLSSFIVSAGALSWVAPEFVEALLQEVAADANPQTANIVLYRVITAIATIIVAPLTEEFIFRGFILQRWGVKWNVPLGLLLSSLLFGLMHPNPIGLTMFGLLMGTLYLKTRSLVIPIAAHAVNNVLATGLMLLPQDPNPTDLTALRSSMPIGILLMTVSAPWLVWFIAKHFPRRDAQIPYVINAQAHMTDA